MSFLISMVFIFLGAGCFSMAVDDFIKKRYWFSGFFIMEMIWMIIYLAKFTMNA